jgi:hypothetical protein
MSVIPPAETRKWGSRRSNGQLWLRLRKGDSRWNAGYKSTLKGTPNASRQHSPSSSRSLLGNSVEGRFLSRNCTVQAVVKDEMSDTDLTTFRAMIVDICDQSFPREWDKSRALCRVYVGQVMGPLMDPEISDTRKSASVMHSVGWSKRRWQEHLLVRSFKIYMGILGAEHPNTLRSMSNLAFMRRRRPPCPGSIPVSRNRPGFLLGIVIRLGVSILTKDNVRFDMPPHQA